MCCINRLAHKNTLRDSWMKFMAAWVEKVCGKHPAHKDNEITSQALAGLLDRYLASAGSLGQVHHWTTRHTERGGVQLFPATVAMPM